jgi:hypothetical protein
MLDSRRWIQRDFRSGSGGRGESIIRAVPEVLVLDGTGLPKFLDADHGLIA